jgi:hypothetical protein
MSATKSKSLMNDAEVWGVLLTLSPFDDATLGEMDRRLTDEAAYARSKLPADDPQETKFYAAGTCRVSSADLPADPGHTHRAQDHDEAETSQAFPAAAEGIGHRPRMSRDLANKLAIPLLRKNPRISNRDLALQIGCSHGLVAKLPAWRAVQEALQQGRSPLAKVVSLTPAVLASEVADEAEPIHKLIADEVRQTTPRMSAHERSRQKIR